MEENVNNSTGHSQELIVKFNRRDTSAFTEVYGMYYDVLYLYASKLFKDTEIDPQDLLHDIFMSLWSAKKMKFDSLLHLKNYLYLSIKNHFRKYCCHQKTIRKYQLELQDDVDYTAYEVVETEVIATLSQMIDSLPDGCSRVLRLYVAGKKTDEIAAELGVSPSTVYNQKMTAIAILKKKYNTAFFKSLFFLL